MYLVSYVGAFEMRQTTVVVRLTAPTCTPPECQRRFDKLDGGTALLAHVPVSCYHLRLVRVRQFVCAAVLN